MSDLDTQLMLSSLLEIKSDIGKCKPFAIFHKVVMVGLDCPFSI